MNVSVHAARWLAPGREARPPERFQLVKHGPSCVLVHEGSRKRFVLPAVECEPERR